MHLTVLASLFSGLLLFAPAAFAQADEDALARRLLNSQGCKACHRIEEAGARTGPSLEKVGDRLTGEQLRARLVNPQRQHASGRIADFSHLQDNEIEVLIIFLSNRK